MKYVVGVLAVVVSAQVVADSDCKYEAERYHSADLDGVREVHIEVGAGDLRVIGGAQQGLQATGQACAGTEEQLAELNLRGERVGDVYELHSMHPDDQGWSLGWRNKVQRIDVAVELPEGIDVVIKDSSGSMLVRNVGNAHITDSSGDMRIEMAVDLDIQDSSGDIEVRNAQSVVLSDSSGSIEVTQAGSVLVENDSSGDIEFSQIADARIINDSSGDIDIRDVRGDVIVERDSSGSISARDVEGDFIVERDSSGGIRFERVAGNVVTPEDSRRKLK
ncbi:MAG: hypothetical protein DHS20C11_16930 [Lysobacteraceae bacterium]|nr:MAG: hypothetical protein DHS20C11_16930 [Xanthomonadaceae bacterium]